MHQFWADVTCDNFQTKELIEDGYVGERIIRISANKRYETFDLFNYLISNWVNCKKSVDYNVLSFLYHEGLEKLRKDRNLLRKRAKLIYSISKIGLDQILSKPKFFVRYLKAQDKITRILISPRVLKSEKFEKYQDFQLFIVVKPGKTKSSFPDEKFIGVGYRDKGHSRIKEQDGRPSWQEIASDWEFQSNQKSVELRKDRHYDLIASDSHRELRARSERRSRKLRQQEFSLLF